MNPRSVTDSLNVDLARVVSIEKNWGGPGQPDLFTITFLMENGVLTKAYFAEHPEAQREYAGVVQQWRMGQL